LEVLCFLLKNLFPQLFNFLYWAHVVPPPRGQTNEPNPGAEITIFDGVDALNIGSASLAGGTNTGLSFSPRSYDPNNATIPAAIPVRFVRFQTDSTTHETTIIVTEEIASDLRGSDDLDGTFDFNGKTLTFVTNAEGIGVARLNNGQEILIELAGSNFVGDSDDSADFSVPFNVQTFDGDQDGFDNAGAFIVGIEAEPNTSPEDLSVDVIYEGNLVGYGNL
jgi:hypothetical protein